jgi:putative nucleotidyltransferase with HDIG domain
MFGLRKRGPKETPRLEAPAIWSDILGSLRPDSSYNERLEAILAALDKVVGFGVYYLYLLDATGKRFTLEYMKGRALEDESEAGKGEIPILGGGDEYEDVHSILRSPLLDFPYHTRHNEPHVTTTRAGSLYAVPLRREGRLVGLVQMGPLDGDSVSRAVGQKVAGLLLPFSFAVTQARQEENLRQRLRSLESQSEVGRRLLSSAFEVGEFIALLLDLALTATGTEAGFVAITEPDGPDGDKLTIRAIKNMPDEFLKRVNLVVGEGLFDWMSEEARTLIVRDYEFVQEMDIQSILAVPLVEGDHLLGLFALVNFQKGETFADYSLKLLSSFVEQIRLVLDNVRLLDQFTQRYLETLKALDKAVDLRDPATVSHTERVTAAAVEIAEKMGLSAHEVGIIRTAAEIHDVGMCGITEAAGGFQADYNHPTIGADMIRILALPPGVANAVASHHEWFDGWGYPNGLKGNEITLGGRILALVEYFVEATTVSEFQPTMTWSKLKGEIEVRRGSQFDPAVVDALLAIVEEKRARAGDGVLGGCIAFKACPPDLQADCPARTDTALCFRHRPEGVRCEGHGDPTCETCFLYVEWQERAGQGE